MQKNAFISVIIPAHQEQNYIVKTLMALKRQSCKNFECIVVANKCTDKTAKLAKPYADKVISIKKKGKSAASNIGVKNARGELIIILDADTVLSDNAIEKISECFTKRHAFGALRGIPNRKKLVYLLLYAYKNFVHRFHLYKGFIGVVITWKQLFLGLGGFDENMQVCIEKDFERKAARFGNYAYIGKAKATTSMRRYEKRGIFNLSVFWLRVWLNSIIFGKKSIDGTIYEIVRS